MKKYNIIRTEEGFLIRNGKLYISSQQVSELFNKKHGNVLSLIRRELEADSKLKKHIIEDKSMSINNKREVPVFLLTKQGFTSITARYQSVEDFKNKANFIETYSSCVGKYKEFKEKKAKKFQDEQASCEAFEPVTTPVTVLTDYTTEEAEAFIVEHTTPVEMVYIPPTETLTVHKQHNNMSVPVIHEVAIVSQQQHDELIKTQVNDENEIIVSGRELHEFLGVNTPYKKWFDRMTEYGFEENQDFITMDKIVYRQDGSQMPQKQFDHALKLDMAKEISMIQRNEKGKQARQYFIETEKRYKQVQQAPAIPMASYMIDNPIERAKLWIQEQQEKVLLAETVNQQVEVIEHKDEIIEKQVEVIQEKEMVIVEKDKVIQEKDKAIETLKGEVVKPINEKFEQAHIMSEGLSPYQMAEAIKYMVENYEGKHNAHANWIRLYNSYEGKYNVNLNQRKNTYAKENNIFGMSVIEYVTEDMIHISQLYALAKEMFTFKQVKKQSNKPLRLADL